MIKLTRASNTYLETRKNWDLCGWFSFKIKMHAQIYQIKIRFVYYIIAQNVYLFLFFEYFTQGACVKYARFSKAAFPLSFFYQ